MIISNKVDEIKKYLLELKNSDVDLFFLKLIRLVTKLIELNKTDMLKYILREFPEALNSCNEMNETPLIISILNDNTDALKAILEKKPDLYIQSFIWGTALTAAIFLDKQEMYRELIRREDSIGINKHPGALIWAVKKNNLELVEILCKKGANPNSTSKDEFEDIDPSLWQFTIYENTPFSLNPNYFSFDLPLNIAIKRNHVDIVKCLLNFEINLDAPGFMGQTPNDLLNLNLNINTQIIDLISDYKSNALPISGELRYSFEEIVSAEAEELLSIGNDTDKKLLLDILFNENKMDLRLLSNYLVYLDQSSRFLVTYCCINPERWDEAELKPYYRAVILSYLQRASVHDNEIAQGIINLKAHAQKLVLDILNPDRQGIELNEDEVERKKKLLDEAKENTLSDDFKEEINADIQDLEEEEQIVIDELQGRDYRQATQPVNINDLSLITKETFDNQWDKIYHTIKSTPTGRVRPKPKMYKIFESILYRERNNCCWKELPQNKVKYTTVRSYYYSWKLQGLFNKILEELSHDQPNNSIETKPGFANNRHISFSHPKKQVGLDEGETSQGRALLNLTPAHTAY